MRGRQRRGVPARFGGLAACCGAWPRVVGGAVGRPSSPVTGRIHGHCKSRAELNSSSFSLCPQTVKSVTSVSKTTLKGSAPPRCVDQAAGGRCPTDGYRRWRGGGLRPPGRAPSGGPWSGQLPAGGLFDPAGALLVPSELLSRPAEGLRTLGSKRTTTGPLFRAQYASWRFRFAACWRRRLELSNTATFSA